MNYYIDKNKKEPAYLQLYTMLREDIVQDIYQLHGKLPSKRWLAMEVDVSVITVEHAYTLLIEEGYIESRQRSGYYVIYKQSDSFQRPSHDRIEIPKTPVKEKFDFPFSTYTKTVRKVLSEYGEYILEKSFNTGCFELRKALVDYLYRSRGMVVQEDQIVIGSGAEYLYSLIVQMVDRDSVIGLEYPSYEKIEKVYRANGAKIEHLQLGKDGILSDALKKSKARILHVTPFHSYPTGISATASKRHEYIEWASSRRLLVEDDYDSEFTILSKPEETLFSMEPNRSVIYLNTFSKTMAPSMRIGYMILPKKRITEFMSRIDFYSCTVPVLDQLVLAEFINHGDFERHINRVRRQKRKAMK